MGTFGTVMVIGAQGTLGRICTDALRAAGADVIRAGRRPEDSADFRRIDLDDPSSVRDGIAGVDLVISTVRHRAHAAERAVREQGGALLNVASLTLADRAQLKADQGESRGVVVVHAGLAPGVYSLVLKDMLADHPDADGVEVAMCFSLIQASGAAGTVDFAYPALTSARRHPTRVITFAAPIGRRRCMQVGGPEIGFFGELAEGRAGRVYITALQRSAQAEFLLLNWLHLLSRIPLRMFQMGRGWTSRRTTKEPKRDIIAVTKDGQRLAGCTVAGAGDYLMTAAATTVFARALLQRISADSPAPGVFGAEELFELSELRDDFDEAGLRISDLEAEINR